MERHNPSKQSTRLGKLPWVGTVQAPKSTMLHDDEPCLSRFFFHHVFGVLENRDSIRYARFRITKFLLPMPRLTTTPAHVYFCTCSLSNISHRISSLSLGKIYTLFFTTDRCRLEHRAPPPRFSAPALRDSIRKYRLPLKADCLPANSPIRV